MNPARWQRIEELYHAALECEAERRSAFLAEVCAGDPALREEVERLLAANEQARSFLATPALELEAQNLAADGSPERYALGPGQQLSHYQILALLGAGGMGEVYLARDTTLAREVALKLLPPRFTDDPDRLRRFRQEARAASALNHPNLVTVYEIGEAKGAHFIATEFIAGDTLRHHLKHAPMSVSDALDLGIQVAGALTAAHAANIIHRDLKPENLMLRPDGYVKVLDFGLAKLLEPLAGALPSNDSQAATWVRADTEPGILVGTTNYMSPEQARGQEVDARTDIFSLGVVLYEMVAGQMPFAGATALDTLVSILEKEPPPLAERVPGLPVELQRIINRALAKEKQQRYESASDLRNDLKRLQDEMAFAARFEGVAPQPPPIVSADVNVSRRRRLGVFVLMAALLAALGIVVVTYYVKRPPASGELNGTSTVGTAPAAATERSLSYSIRVQRYRDGTPYSERLRLDDDIQLGPSDELRFTLSSPQPGYLYIFNKGPAPMGKAQRFNILFPSSLTNNGSSQVKADQPVDIPEVTWLRMDKQPGTEKVWLVWADAPLAELEAARKYASPPFKGEIESSKLNAEVEEFLNAHAALSGSVERSEDLTKALAKGQDRILVRLIQLEHH